MLVIVGGVGIGVFIGCMVGNGTRSGFTGISVLLVVTIGAVGMLILVVSVEVSLGNELVVTINGGVGSVTTFDVVTLFKHSSFKPKTHDDDSS